MSFLFNSTVCLLILEVLRALVHWKMSSGNVGRARTFVIIISIPGPWGQSQYLKAFYLDPYSLQVVANTEHLLVLAFSGHDYLDLDVGVGSVAESEQ